MEDVSPAAPLMNVYITEQTTANEKQETQSGQSLFRSPIYCYLDIFSERQYMKSERHLQVLQRQGPHLYTTSHQSLQVSDHQWNIK